MQPGRTLELSNSTACFLQPGQIERWHMIMIPVLCACPAVSEALWPGEEPEQAGSWGCELSMQVRS